MSLYYGLSAGLQLLSVSFLSIALYSSTFTNCSVRSNAFGGNVYGGAVSLHIGAYSSASCYTCDETDVAVAVVGDTVVRDVNVTLDSVNFKSCSAIRDIPRSSSIGANVYGGSFSFQVGAYAWSFSAHDSISTCGSTSASGIRVLVQNTTSVDSSALTSAGGDHDGANSYGGSMSVLHVGAYSYSTSQNWNGGQSISTCEATSVSDVSIHVSGSGCANCSAISTSGYKSFGANAYGGSMSVLHVGPYSWSRRNGLSTNAVSSCEVTTASDVSVHVSGSGCVNCSAISTSGGLSYGANSYGGALSAAFIGAYSYIYVINWGGRFVIASVKGTKVVRLSVTIQDSTFVDAVAAVGEYSTHALDVNANRSDVIS